MKTKRGRPKRKASDNSEENSSFSHKVLTIVDVAEEKPFEETNLVED